MLVLVLLLALGKKQGGELEGIEMCIWILVYLILIIVIFLFLDREFFFHIKKTVIVDCLELGKVIVFKWLIHFL